MASGIENALLNSWVQAIILTVVLGILALLFRRGVWRFFASIYLRVANPTIGVSILVVRSYPPFDTTPISHAVLERIRTEVPGAEVTDRFKESVDVVIPGYGKFHTRIEQVGFPEDELTAETTHRPTETRIVMESDVPVRMGARNVENIAEFVPSADRVIQCVASAASPNPPSPSEDYIVLDLPRFHPVPEGAPTLDEEDSFLKGIRVHATPEKLEITTPLVLLGKAVKKYRFA
jgi:hypothetical protein